MPLINLPGIRLDLTDGNLRPRSTPTQPKVTLIGVTNNPGVSSGEVVRVESDDDARRFDNMYASDSVTPDPSGPIGKPSELTLAVAEAFSGGADHVEVMALPNSASVDTKLGLFHTPSERYDALEEAYTLLRFTPVDIVVPVNTQIDATGLSASQNYGWQLANFCHQTSINERTCIGVIGTTPAVAGNTVPTIAEQEAWVAALETFDTTAVLGADFTIGDGITATGVDPLNQGPDTYAFYATSDETIPVGAPTPRFDADIEYDKKNKAVDIGRYLSITAETARFINEESGREAPTLGYYHNNIASSYAGLISSIPSFVGTTNQIMRGMTPVRALAPTQVERLANKRFVSLINRPTGYVVADGVTWAHRISDEIRSDFTQLTTIRIAFDAVNFVRASLFRYLGQPNNAQIRAAIEADIDVALSNLQRLGALQKYTFRLNLTAQKMVLGKMDIEMTLTPAFEIKQITLTTGLSAEL
jgi:hypothetical protein